MPLTRTGRTPNLALKFECSFLTKPNGGATVALQYEIRLCALGLILPHYCWTKKKMITMTSIIAPKQHSQG